MKFKLLREGVEKDSLGNVLTPEQSRYFAHSKVLDGKGNLLVTHHGTDAAFDVFDKGDIGFHFGTERSASERHEYQSAIQHKQITDWKIDKYYLNITHPFKVEFDYGGWDGVSIACAWLFGTSGDGYTDWISDGILPEETYIPTEFANDIEEIKRISLMDSDDISYHGEGSVAMRKLFKKRNFDGIFYLNEYEGAGDWSYIAFYPEQIKRISNKNPTTSKRIDEGADEDDDLLMSNFIDNLTSKYTSMTSEQMLSFLSAPQRDSLDVDSPMFILPNGKIISVSDVLKANKVDFELTHNAVCECFMWLLMNNLDYSHDEIEYLSDYEWKLEPYEYKILDVLTYKFNWARINCGRTWMESRFYCVLPDTMTSAQYRTLEEWLEWGADIGRKNVLVFAKHKPYDYTYSLTDSFPEEIIKNIKRFYSSGRFYESIQHLVIDEESDDYDELFVADSVRELKRFMDTTPWDEFKVVDSSDHDGNYYIGNPYRYIHSEILRKADLNGWFPDDNILTLHRSFVDSELILIERGKGQHRGMFGEDWYDYMFIFEDYTILARDDIRHAPLIKQFGKLLEIREFDESEENPEGIVLSEGLNRLAPNAFITDSPYQVRNLLMNKPKLYRILYDSNIDMYMIGDGQEVIHWDLIKAARKQGYYAEMEEFIDELGDLENYVEFGEGGQFLDDEEIDSYLIYMVYSPDDDTFILGEDGYQFRYPLSQGVMFTRDSYLEDCDLYRVLKSMMPVSLTEARKDFSDKYPSVEEAQDYIMNNYATETLPPTGATFLMPNGLFIDLGASHMTVHQEFDEQVYTDLVDGGDYVGEFGYTDLFLTRLGFIRCNDGTTMGSLLVHLPSQKPTRQQYEALEGWLEASLSMEMYNYIIIATDNSTKRYDLGDYMTEELMALIKRYYSSGRLYEDDEREDTPQNNPNEEETSEEEPDIIDKAQEIKDNIKASFTERS